MNNADAQLGRFFAGWAFLVAVIFLALAVYDAPLFWKLGYLGAVSGWWLTGMSILAIVKERTKKRRARSGR